MVAMCVATAILVAVGCVYLDSSGGGKTSTVIVKVVDSFCREAAIDDLQLALT